MKYRGYLSDLAVAFRHRFEQISTHFNFDYGDEFEIALCYVLREILPQKYGICRGFVVPADGPAAGDDIIIYDRERFPTLRLFPQESYDRKQNIPVEAVYVYIEAKNTLHLNTDKDDNQSIVRASAQVSAVKRVPRSERQPEFLHPYFVSNASYGNRQDWPYILNPMLGVVVARNVKDSSGKLLDSVAVTKHLSEVMYPIEKPPPDLIIAGDSTILAPTVGTSNGEEVHSPFYIEGRTSGLRTLTSQGLGFALGVCFLLYALDTIQLGRMPWEIIINDGLGF